MPSQNEILDEDDVEKNGAANDYGKVLHFRENTKRNSYITV